MTTSTAPAGGELGVMDLGVIGVPNVQRGEQLYFTSTVLFNPTGVAATVWKVEVLGSSPTVVDVAASWYPSAEHPPPPEGDVAPPLFASPIGSDGVTLAPMVDASTAYPQSDPSSVRLGVVATSGGAPREVVGAFVITYTLAGDPTPRTVRAPADIGGVWCDPAYTAEHQGACI